MLENWTLSEAIIIFGLICILPCLVFVLLVWVQDREWKKKFAELEVGARYFLLNMDTTQKMFIEIIAKDEENMRVTARNRRNDEDVITVYYRKFFSAILVRDSHHYYEKLSD